MRKIVECFGEVGSMLWLTLVMTLLAVWGTWLVVMVLEWSQWKEALFVAAGCSMTITPVLSWLFHASLQEVMAQQSEWKSLATVDSLTGIHNRRSFLGSVERELQRLSTMERPSTLLLLDVDHFKSINDTYGHPVGDDVLRAISQICGTSVRHSDIVGRLGGEEFAIFLPGTSQENAMNLAKRLRERLDSFIVCHQGRRVPFTASIGVASSGPDDDINSLMREADRALYAAKRNGRNRVEVRWLTAFSQV